MIYKELLCRFCSIESYDIRVFRLEKYSMQCLNCNHMLFLQPIDVNSPYYYLEEQDTLYSGELGEDMDEYINNRDDNYG